MSAPSGSSGGSASPSDSVRSGAPGLRIGQLFGIPVYLGRMWALIGLVIVVVFGPQIGRAVPDIGAGAYLVAAAYAVLLLLSVLIHEVAHAAVARARGLRVTRIVADLWGGHTSYEAAAVTPGTSALVAVVGPLANAAVALLGLWARDSIDGDVPFLLVSAAAVTNGFVAVFNLLPGLPLDGGFLLEALVWRVTGSRSAGLIVAGWSGRLLTLGFLVWAVLLPLLNGRAPDLFSLVWILAIGAFLWAGATQAIRAGRAGRALDRVDLRDLERPAVGVDGRLPVAEVARVMQSRPDAQAVVLLAPDGEPQGVFDLETARRVVDPSTAQTVAASAFLAARPFGWAPAPPPGSARVTLTAVITALTTLDTDIVVIRDGSGTVRAVVLAGDLEAHLSGR